MADRSGDNGDHGAGARQAPDALMRNIVHFARTLRKAGLGVGPAQVANALAAVEKAGLASREDFYWTLHAVFITEKAQTVIFDQAFHLFWRARGLIEEMMALMLPRQAAPPMERPPRAAARRVSEALTGGPQKAGEKTEIEIERQADLTFSDTEVLRKKDFEQMDAAEEAAARAAIARLVLPFSEIRSRRFRPSMAGEAIDLRASLRASLRTGGEPLRLMRRQRRTRIPPLVVLCDISGSMESYSRMLLHFLHGMSRTRGHVHSFVFGTRLSNITRRLAARDVDEALALIAEDVEDFAGGTRIGACLKAFNRDWARRVLGGQANVLLITDGLDRGDVDALAAEMARLRRAAARLIWLNPLLRFDGFEPRAGGIRAMLEHVDEFRACHSLESLGELVDMLGADTARQMRPADWLKSA